MKQNHLRRRQLLGGALGATALLGSTSLATAQAKMTYKASDVHPEGYPTVTAVESMGKKLSAATNGRLSVQMYVDCSTRATSFGFER